MLNAVRRLFLPAACLLLGAGVQRSLGRAVPPLLERMPASAPGAIIAPSMERLDRNSAALLASMEITTASTLFQIMRVLGPFETLDPQGDAAIVLLSIPEERGAGLETVMILPTRGFEPFAQALDATPGEGLRSFQYNNATYFTRPFAGSYALIGADEALVRGFGEGERLEIPRPTSEIVAGADIFGYLTGEALRTLAAEQLADALKDAPIGQVSGMAAMGGRTAGELSEALGRYLQGARMMVIAGSFDPLGARFDLAISYDAESELGAMAVSEPGRSAVAELSRLPEGEFLAVWSATTSQPLMRRFIESLAQQGDKVSGALAGVLEESSSAGIAIYSPDAPIMIAGPLGKALVRWTCEDPASSRDAFAQMLVGTPFKGADGSEVTVSYARDKFQRAGRPVDVFSLTPPPGAGAFGQSAYVKGFLAVGENECTLTVEQEEPLLLGAALGLDDEDATLADDRIVSQLLAFVPASPEGLLLLNIDPIVKQFKMFISMAMPGVAIPENLPPIISSLDLHDATARVTVFAPAPVLKLGVSLQRAASAASQRTTPRAPEPEGASDQ